MLRRTQLHTAAGNWYNWGTYFAAQNTKAEFIRAWRHIVTLFRNERAPVKFQLTYNCHKFRSDPSPFRDWYPGRQYVDMLQCNGASLIYAKVTRPSSALLTCGGYNRAGLESERVETFLDVTKDAYFRLASLDPTLPIGEQQLLQHFCSC
eukprot:13608-Heterococcus_DN1.PRE.1